MPDKEKKAGNFGKKIIKFFSDIKAELKKVIWPDRKKLVQSTATVLAICAIMAALVFVIDKVLSGSLEAVGFFPDTSSKAVSLPVSVPAISVELSSESSSAEESSQDTSSEQETSETDTSEAESSEG